MRIDVGGHRFYQIGDALYPSVTSVLSVIHKDLSAWQLRECVAHVRKQLPLGQPVTRGELDSVLSEAIQQPALRLQEACSFGTMAHEHAARYITSGRLPSSESVDPKMRSWMDRFARWWDGSGLTCVLSEQLCWSETYRYAGTLDALACDQYGNLFVLDFKSSNTLCGAGNYILQGVAYKWALWEQAERLLPDWGNEIATADVMIVRLGKRDSSLDVLQVDQMHHHRYHAAFMAARALFDWIQDSEGIVRRALRPSVTSRSTFAAQSR